MTFTYTFNVFYALLLYKLPRKVSLRVCTANCKSKHLTIISSMLLFFCLECSIYNRNSTTCIFLIMVTKQRRTMRLIERCCPCVLCIRNLAVRITCQLRWRPKAAFSPPALVLLTGCLNHISNPRSVHEQIVVKKILFGPFDFF